MVDLTIEKIPADRGGTQFRHGGTLGEATRHWFRAKTGAGRYRLFYRFHAQSKVIVLWWINDEQGGVNDQHTLRTRGATAGAYAVSQRMLDSGNPPDPWQQLVHAWVVAPSALECGLRRRPSRPVEAIA